MGGFKPLPIALKFLSVVLLLWAALSVVGLMVAQGRQVPFFGVLLDGTAAATVIVLLDFISPLLFIFAAWKRLKWGAKFGMLYNGIFILNNLIALFLFLDVFGNGIYFPLLASTLFLIIIYRERGYFS